MGSLLDPALPRLVEAISQVLLGKQEQVRLALASLLAGGHLLIEDRPGMGKSTLAETLARGSSLAFKRVSFTSDLLPADLTGIIVLDAGTAQFRFQAGPLFSQVLLADEINRASPRTQAPCSRRWRPVASAWMAPASVAQPFFVIATQNSLDQVGTSPLPEAQLDRFLMRISLGFPDEGGAHPAAGRWPGCLRAAGLPGCRRIAGSAATLPPAALLRRTDQLRAGSDGRQPPRRPWAVASGQSGAGGCCPGLVAAGGRDRPYR